MRTPVPHRHEGWRQTVVLPRDLREPLATIARRNERSTAAEIRFAVKAHVDREQKGARA
jgi:hypothetical protein